MIAHLYTTVALCERADAVVVVVAALVNVSSHLAGVHAVWIQVIGEKLPVLHIDHVGLGGSASSATFESIH